MFQLSSMGFTVLLVLVIVCWFSFVWARTSKRATRKGKSHTSDRWRFSDVDSHKKRWSDSRLNTPPKRRHDGQVTTSSRMAIHAVPQATPGFFTNAQDVFLNKPTMININEAKYKVLKWLSKFVMSGVEFNSSGHVFGCHPHTRVKVLRNIDNFINATQLPRQMLWLHAPAGVGKSAIIQSLAESLSESSGASKLGASLSLSRKHNRDKATLVFPTIAYQLAIRISPYKEYLESIMVRDPRLLEKKIECQFQALIVDPFTELQWREDDRWVILLDGLDECNGDEAQILIVELVTDFIHKYPAAPLVWVIASRPEAHLPLTSTSHEVGISIHSVDGCRDVEKYLSTKFKDIRRKYRDLISADTSWPAKQDRTRIFKASSGFFALAATVAHFIEDPQIGDPVRQLDTILSVTKGLEPGSLSALYALYDVILVRVPPEMLSVLKELFSFYAIVWKTSSLLTSSDGGKIDFPLVVVAAVFGLKQNVVYGALRRLYSVIDVPSPNESGRRGIRFYHPSFSDYLDMLDNYTIDVDVTTKMWRGLFTWLHRSGSTVPSSWVKVKLADAVLEGLRDFGLGWLLHTLIPTCQRRDSFRCPNPHIFLKGPELQGAFEKIDFSILCQPGCDNISDHILDLLDWLVAHAPRELKESKMVEVIYLKDLNLSKISRTKGAYVWDITGAHGSSEYATRSKSRIRTDSMFSPYPPKMLRILLKEIRRDNPAVNVVLVGAAPCIKNPKSRRCALISTYSQLKEWGKLFYLPIVDSEVCSGQSAGRV